MKILMVASEAAPFAKTGGLADVVGSLPAALKSLGHEVAVLMPRYTAVDLETARRVYDSLPLWLPPDRYDASLYVIQRETPFYFLDCPPLFDRAGLYGEGGLDYPDNHVRFAILAQAALAICRYVFRPDIIHCHDWQAGLVPAYLRSIYANDPTFLAIRTLFTVHNVGYHGLFPAKVLNQIGLADASVFRPDGLEFFGKVCYLKGGLSFRDALNTVSPTYAREIQTPEYCQNLKPVPGSMVSSSPPVARTTGTVPYFRLKVWFKPQGSYRLGIRNRSAPASILCASALSYPTRTAMRPGCRAAIARNSSSYCGSPAPSAAR